MAGHRQTQTPFQLPSSGRQGAWIDLFSPFQKELTELFRYSFELVKSLRHRLTLNKNWTILF
jgi:hypothetical protein